MNDYGPGDRPKHAPEEPWWNDKDKIGGAAATISMLVLISVISIILIACAIKVALWIV